MPPRRDRENRSTGSGSPPEDWRESKQRENLLADMQRELARAPGRGAPPPAEAPPAPEKTPDELLSWVREVGQRVEHYRFFAERAVADKKLREPQEEKEFDKRRKEFDTLRANTEYMLLKLPLTERVGQQVRSNLARMEALAAQLSLEKPTKRAADLPDIALPPDEPAPPPPTTRRELKVKPEPEPAPAPAPAPKLEAPAEPAAGGVPPPTAPVPPEKIATSENPEYAQQAEQVRTQVKDILEHFDDEKNRTRFRRVLRLALHNVEEKGEEATGMKAKAGIAKELGGYDRSRRLLREIDSLYYAALDAHQSDGKLTDAEMTDIMKKVDLLIRNRTKMSDALAERGAPEEILDRVHIAPPQPEEAAPEQTAAPEPAPAPEPPPEPMNPVYAAMARLEEPLRPTEAPVVTFTEGRAPEAVELKNTFSPLLREYRELDSAIKAKKKEFYHDLSEKKFSLAKTQVALGRFFGIAGSGLPKEIRDMETRLSQLGKQRLGFHQQKYAERSGKPYTGTAFENADARTAAYRQALYQRLVFERVVKNIALQKEYLSNSKRSALARVIDWHRGLSPLKRRVIGVLAATGGLATAAVSGAGAVALGVRSANVALAAVFGLTAGGYVGSKAAGIAGKGMEKLGDKRLERAARVGLSGEKDILDTKDFEKTFRQFEKATAVVESTASQRKAAEAVAAAAVGFGAGYGAMSAATAGAENLLEPHDAVPPAPPVSEPPAAEPPPLDIIPRVPAPPVEPLPPIVPVPEPVIPEAPPVLEQPSVAVEPAPADGAQPETPLEAADVRAIQRGDTLWTIMDGRAPGREMSAALAEIPSQYRNAALVELFQRVDADTALREAVGMRSTNANLIYVGENLNIAPLEQTLHNIAVERGWVAPVGAAAPEPVPIPTPRPEVAPLEPAAAPVEPATAPEPALAPETPADASFAAEAKIAANEKVFSPQELAAEREQILTEKTGEGSERRSRLLTGVFGATENPYVAVRDANLTLGDMREFAEKPVEAVRQLQALNIAPADFEKFAAGLEQFAEANPALAANDNMKVVDLIDAEAERRLRAA